MAALAAVPACMGPLEPDRVRPPELRQIEFNAARSSFHDGGVLFLYAWPRDTAFRLPRDQRLPVELTVSSGDRETVGLYRRNCPARDRGFGYPCFQFTVHMQPGHAVAGIADRVAAIGGRFSQMAPGNFATVILFHPEVVREARRAMSWPGVSSVVLYGEICPPETLGCFSESHLLVPLPMDTGAAVPGDGIVQVRSGDTVTATYPQPDGGSIDARLVVP